MQNRPKRSRTWIWFFLTVIVLSAIAVTALIVYNLGQQLQPAELLAARKLWADHGPKSYRLVYAKKRGDGVPETIVVHVRHGATEFVTIDGREVVEPRQFVFFGMDAMLDDIERFLQFDREEGRPRTFLRAAFDPKDGHVRNFVRRVMGSRERVELTVLEFEPLTPR